MTAERLDHTPVIRAESTGSPIHINGEAEVSPGDILIKTVRAIYEGENGSVGQASTYIWRRDLGNSLTPSFFRKLNLSRELNVEFGGDIPLVVRDAFPDPVGKPLLALDYPRPTDELYNEWSQREEAIDSRIEATRSVKRQLELPFFREKKVKHGGKWIRVQTRERHFERIDVDNWYQKENEGLNRVVAGLVKPGDTVCSFLSGHDAVLPSIVLSQTKGEGQLFVVTPSQYLDEGLFANFLNLLVDLERVKGLDRKERRRGRERKKEKLERDLSGSSLVNGAFREEASAFLSHPYRYNERFYNEGLNWQNSLLMQRFFERFNIHPVGMDGADFPSEIQSNSFDCVVEADRFAEIPEEEIEAVLYELDRALRPGGFLVIREGARQQAMIEYYGKELLDGSYSRLKVPGIKSRRVVVLQKEGAREPVAWTIADNTVEKSSRNVSRKESRVRLKHSFKWLIEEGGALINIETNSEIQKVLNKMDPERSERLRMTRLEASSVFIWLNQVNREELDRAAYIEESGTFHNWRRLQRGKQWELLIFVAENNKMVFHLRRLPEGELWKRATADESGGQNHDTSDERKKLITDLITVISQSDNSNGSTLGLSWFRERGYIPLLITEFGGSMDKALEAARRAQQVAAPEVHVVVKPPKEHKPFYTIQELAKELEVSISSMRDLLQRHIGVRRAKSSWRLTPGNVSSKKTVPLHFTHQEYQTIRRALESKAKEIKEKTIAKPKENKENEGGQ